MADILMPYSFSLIVGTLGRNAELKRLLNSLRLQSECRFELLLIDQSAGALDLTLLEHSTFPIRRITAERGLSRSRNIGLKFAQGEFVAFPDDDCTYPAGLLEALGNEFSIHPEYDGISVKVTDQNGNFSAGGYMAAESCRMTKRNIWRTAVSPSLFFRRSAVSGIFFDETLGVGCPTPFQSGEETDFCLQLIEKGCYLSYLPRYSVFHPVFHGPFVPERAWGYGVGMGGVLRKHHYSFLYVWLFSIYQLGRFFQHLLCGHIARAFFHLKMSRGRICGYFFWKNYHE